jgi:hypothetical protein
MHSEALARVVSTRCSFAEDFSADNGLRTVSDHLRYFSSASGPIMQCAALQYPSEEVEKSCMFGSALCIWLGAAFGVIEVADRHSGRAKESA